MGSEMCIRDSTTAGVIFVIWFLVDTDIGNTMSKKFMSYFKPTFESVMYDGCILEGKHSEKICSCFSKEINKILPENGKNTFLRVIELENGKSNGFQADLKTSLSVAQYLPQMIKASQNCGISIF